LIDPNHDKVLELFHYRCVCCNKPADCVHEIVPRSRRPKTWMEIDNRVALCMVCHAWAHSRGAKTSAPELIRLRQKRLRDYESDYRTDSF
jgi:5-methylcytosine-specific restriction endonuclease McrA